MADQGGRACIGTFWSVRDEESTLFSKEFYRNFFFKRKTLGDSVRQARLKVKKSEEDAILTWPAFVLYGPPILRTSDILI
jgi:CHAT domain-containing protein